MPSRVLNKHLPALKQKLIAKQNGVCSLCKRDITRMQSINQCVDHDHDTGVIREVLCRSCNGIEGKIRNLAIRCATKEHHKAWLYRLAEYLKKHDDPQTSYIHPTWKTEAEKKLAKNAKARKRYQKKTRETSSARKPT